MVQPTRQPGTDTGFHTAFKAWVLEKTFKREVAIMALFLWLSITVKVFWFTDVASIRALDSVYGTVTTTIWLYVVAAFGMDWVSKQMGDAKSRERYGDTFGPRDRDRPGDREMGGRFDRPLPSRPVDQDRVVTEPVHPPPQEPGETDPSIPPKDYGVDRH